jgi:hypothetical protein
MLDIELLHTLGPLSESEAIRLKTEVEELQAFNQLHGQIFDGRRLSCNFRRGPRSPDTAFYDVPSVLQAAPVGLGAWDKAPRTIPDPKPAPTTKTKDEAAPTTPKRSKRDENNPFLRALRAKGAKSLKDMAGKRGHQSPCSKRERREGMERGRDV